MKKSALLVGIALILFSCNSGNKESSSSGENSQMASKSSDGNSYDCLKPFVEDYSKLLTKEDMASVYAIDFENAKVKLSTGNYGEHIYSWPSDRPDKDYGTSAMKIIGPDNNTMGVSLLSFYSDESDLNSSRDNFEMGYKQLSEAELNQIEENLSKQKDEVKEAGKDFMKVRAKSSWEFVEGTGSSAWYKWSQKFGGELAVLAGKAKFNIKVKVSEDPEENRELAKKLAEKILDKCN